MTALDSKFIAQDITLLSLPPNRQPSFNRALLFIIFSVLIAHFLILFVAQSVAPVETLNLPNVIDVALDAKPATPPTQSAVTHPMLPAPIPPIVKADATLTETAKQEPVLPASTIAPAAVNTPNNETSEPVIQPLFKLSKMPSFSRKNEPIYPANERRAGVQATVIAEVTINELGKVLSIKILKSGGVAFDEAVKAALQQSEFSPGLIDGKPVSTRFQIPYRFSLT